MPWPSRPCLLRAHLSGEVVSRVCIGGVEKERVSTPESLKVGVVQQRGAEAQVAGVQVARAAGQPEKQLHARAKARASGTPRAARGQATNSSSQRHSTACQEQRQKSSPCLHCSAASVPPLPLGAQSGSPEEIDQGLYGLSEHSSRESSPAQTCWFALPSACLNCTRAMIGVHQRHLHTCGGHAGASFGSHADVHLAQVPVHASPVPAPCFRCCRCWQRPACSNCGMDGPAAHTAPSHPRHSTFPLNLRQVPVVQATAN
jgi:hypothetical protein